MENFKQRSDTILSLQIESLAFSYSNSEIQLQKIVML